jgi:hypothetical protein
MNACEISRSRGSPVPGIIRCLVLGLLALTFPGPVRAQSRAPVEKTCLFINIGVGRRARGLEREIAELRQQLAAQQQLLTLMAQQQALRPQTPPVIVVPGPLQTLPIEGQPRQQLPIGGTPRQDLPIQGTPRQELPPQGAPRQELLPQGAPRQQFGQPGEGKPFLPPPGNARPAGPIAYNHALWRLVVR